VNTKQTDKHEIVKTQAHYHSILIGQLDSHPLEYLFLGNMEFRVADGHLFHQERSQFAPFLGIITKINNDDSNNKRTKNIQKTL
jgi:hypothetical protein